MRTLSAFARYGSSDLAPVLYVLAPFVEAYRPLCEAFETVISPLDGVNRARRMLAESTWLAARTVDADAVHHLGGRLPGRSRRPAAVTVHDLQPLIRPENFSPARPTNSPPGSGSVPNGWPSCQWAPSGSLTDPTSLPTRRLCCTPLPPIPTRTTWFSLRPSPGSPAATPKPAWS